MRSNCKNRFVYKLFKYKNIYDYILLQNSDIYYIKN